MSIMGNPITTVLLIISIIISTAPQVFACPEFLSPPSADNRKVESEKFRIELKNRLASLRLQLESVQNDALISYRRSVNANHAKKRIPSIKDTTMSALNKFDQAVGNHETETDAREASKQAVDTDPYFKWLTANSRFIEPLVASSSIRNQGGLVEFRTIGHTPKALLFHHMSNFGPNYLPPEIAIVRLQRDLDPSLSNEDREGADSILKISQILYAFSRVTMDVTTSHSGTRWSYATGLDDAINSFNEMTQRLVDDLGPRFPEASFAKLKIILENSGPDAEMIRAIEKHFFRTKSGIRDLPPDAPPTYDIAAAHRLIEKLGLPANTDPELLYHAKAATADWYYESNYHEFLHRTFRQESSAQNSPYRSDTWFWLRSIAQIAFFLKETGDIKPLVNKEKAKAVFTY